jgi:hypothetical protein
LRKWPWRIAEGLSGACSILAAEERIPGLESLRLETGREVLAEDRDALPASAWR